MKETVLDLLMFLFENYMEDEDRFPPHDQRAGLQLKLLEAGFDHDEIEHAFGWLEGVLEQGNSNGAEQTGAFRVYSDEEQAVLDVDARGFLMQLEQIGVLSASARETVIERAMALGEDEIDVERLKWIVLLVLFAKPGEEQAFAWMEDLVFEDAAVLH
jgi:Smg protein